ncbi:hypothetical protein [Nosocomiicoccus sp. HMSC059G07]|uniref:hypothetical protein n=1 Tax=Nosocomiicoccus sp. HMSC059G07 TaxID=1739531 RepID=UPI0008A3DD30|nr:hypothetical protein [Nosocomiicoccus sp. HMSC059G07]OFO55636.1 hypothetical protein HMPREF3029_03420 [Nosocomiicoccus sp. HMSC059G07]
MNERGLTQHLFPRTKSKENLTVEEMNRRSQEKADVEELAHMRYLKHLNEENKRNRTGAKNNDL